MKYCINGGNVIRLLSLSAKLLKFKIQKCGQILCAHKPYFLMPGHKLRFTLYCIPKLRGEAAILYPMNTTVNLIMERYYILLQISLKVTPLLYPLLIV